MWFKSCFFFVFFYIFCSSDHFVQPGRMILAILVKGHMRNISGHWPSRRLMKDVLFLASVAILFNGAKPF